MTDLSNQDDPASPCVGVCRMNPQTDLCEGCFRTLDEITQWWDYSSDDKRRVLMQTEQRYARIIEGAFFD